MTLDQAIAFLQSVQTKIGRVRSLYYLLGLLDPEVIALDRPLYPYWPSVRLKFADYRQ